MEEGDGEWTRERVVTAIVMTLLLCVVLGAAFVMTSR
jgi:hypothetical protein